MATIRPFQALRPTPEKAEEIASVPYDVITADEARQLAEGKPLSFLHVIRPEIDLLEGTDEHDEAVYERGAANLRDYANSGHAIREEAPALYVYELVMDGHEQTGIYGCVSVAEFDDDTILKHEETRPAKEEDRMRHMLEQRAHAEPVLLTYRGQKAIDDLVAQTKMQTPLYDFEASDGVQHTVWKVEDAEAVVDAFREVDKLYVADGHHRCKAASRVAAVLGGEAAAGQPEYAFFPAVLFPMADLRILPYNRVVRKLPAPAGAFLEQLRERFEVKPADDGPAPKTKGTVSVYLDGAWHWVRLPETRRDAVADRLDVARLNEFILEPMLGITDPRTDANVDFVGGSRGTEELEALVDAGKAALAIAMYPTSVEELVVVSDAGLLMPPKSTWFEPKLRSGLLVHLFD